MTSWPITSLIPHDPPMALLDELVDHEGSRSACRVTIRPDSIFAGERGVPSYVTLEYMAQAIAAHGGFLARTDGAPVQKGFLLGTPRLSTFRPFLAPGTVLRVEVEQVWGDDALLHFACRVIDEDTQEIVAESGVRVLKPKEPDALIDGRRADVPGDHTR